MWIVNFMFFYVNSEMDENVKHFHQSGSALLFPEKKKKIIKTQKKNPKKHDVHGDSAIVESTVHE